MVVSQADEAAVRFSVERSATVPDRVVLRGADGLSSRLILLAGYDGPGLPEVLTDVAVEPDGTGDSGWRLRSAQGVFRFRATTVEQIDGRPQLWRELHRPFALSARERTTALLLLKLLRLPGATWLLRGWHGLRG